MGWNDLVSIDPDLPAIYRWELMAIQFSDGTEKDLKEQMKMWKALADQEANGGPGLG